MIAVRVGHGDGLRASADERVLATAARGRAKFKAGRHLDGFDVVDVDFVKVDIDT